LRKARKLISIYPNFYILSNSPNTAQSITQEFHQLLDELHKAIGFLGDMCQKIQDKRAKKQFYMRELSNSQSAETFSEAEWR
jgi:Skp family chaperone for outer membrane proteins